MLRPTHGGRSFRATLFHAGMRPRRVRREVTRGSRLEASSRMAQGQDPTLDLSPNGCAAVPDTRKPRSSQWRAGPRG